MIQIKFKPNADRFYSMKHVALTLSLAAGILLLLAATNALADTPHVTRAQLRCTYSDVIKCSVVKEARI